MATAGEGTSYEQGGGGGGGGAGGKFRKRPFRRGQATPYDRPPTALRNPSSSWLSKLVDPASKLITSSAHMFFSSVFRKRLGPPPPPSPPAQPLPGPIHDSRNAIQVDEVVSPNNPPGPKESSIHHGMNTSTSSEGGGISELEQMLKQKTFTRYEIDRLTELLQSRTVDLPVGDRCGMTEANLTNPVSGFESQDGFGRSPIKENGIGSIRLHGVVSTPLASSSVLEEDAASPAELAKAYMGSRPSKVSPSLLGLRSQALKEDATSLDIVPFSSKSPMMSVASKSVFPSRVPENGLVTPRTRGRSAIYSMARTPYSRVYSTANQKGSRFATDGNGGPSSIASSQFLLERDGVDESLGSKQSLKRRSSVFSEDIGSVGPIRRIRQKSNLLSPRSSSVREAGHTASSYAMGVGSSAAQEKRLLMDKPRNKVSGMLQDDEGNLIQGTGFALVPSKSTETATKILQHLERLTPKEKPSGSKLAAGKDKSPSKLTTSMLSGKALKSLDDVDSSKFLQNVGDSRRLEVSHTSSPSEARESTSQKQDKVEENGIKTLVAPRDASASAVHTMDTTVSTKSSIPSTKMVSASTNFVSQPPQKKRAFQMSAHEDSLELDDDVHSNGDVSKALADGGNKSLMPIITEAPKVNKNFNSPKVESPAGFELTKKTDLEVSDGVMTGEKKSSFTFSTPASNTILEPTVPTSKSGPAFDRTVQPNEANASPPLFGFVSKSAEKLSTFNSNASSSPSESSLVTPNASSDAKPESSKSFLNISFGATAAATKIADSDRSDNSSNSQKVGDIKGTSLPAFSSAVGSTSTSTSSTFSFGASANSSSPNNGSLTSSPFMFSSATGVPSPSNLANQNVTNGSIQFGSPTSITTTSTSPDTTITASSGTVTSSAVLPSFSAAPIFRFGSSVSSSSMSTAPTTSDVQKTSSNVNAEKNANFGISSSSFGATSSAMPSFASGTFGSTASGSVSTATDQSQSSLFGTGSGPQSGMHMSPAASGGAATTQTSLALFGSSSSAPLFSSASTTFTSSSSLFGSSTPTASLFTSATGFSISSAPSSSGTNSIGSSSGASSSTSIFGSTWPPNKSPVFGATTGSSLFNSPSPSTGFSFGASSTPAAAPNSAVPFSFGASSTPSTAPNSVASMVFGSSTGASSSSLFSFTSSAGNTSSLAPFSQTQPVFGNSASVFTASPGNNDQMNMEDSMSEDPVQASSHTVSVFGQPPTSPAPGVMFGSSAPSSGLAFQFGGQQSQAAPQNPSPFASGSVDFNAGGSFSLGSGGGEKSARKIVRVNKNKNRRK